MKVMFLPLNYGNILQKGASEAFVSAGANLQVFDYFAVYNKKRFDSRMVQQELLREVENFQPDLLHLQIQHTNIIDWKTISVIKKRWPKIRISNWTGDVRTYVPKSYKAIAQFSDFNFISSTGQIKMFENEIGRPVLYWQIGFDPKLYKPDVKTPSEFEFDTMFIANNTNKESYPGRIERELTCKLLQQSFGNRFAMYGSGWGPGIKSRGSVDQKKLANDYHKSLSSISVNHFNEINHYFSDRLLLCMACGRPVISLVFPKWEAYFTNNCDLIMVNSVKEIPEKVKFLKKNRDFAEYVGRMGAKKVYAEHTYLSRINELLHIVGLK